MLVTFPSSHESHDTIMSMALMEHGKGVEKRPQQLFAGKLYAPLIFFEMWGDGEQTRSFMFVDDCVEGTLRIMHSECEVPLNLGTEQMVSMNEFAAIAMGYENKTLPIKHIPGPQGVRGRNSDNTMIRDKLGWEPLISIEEGLRQAYFWIKSKVDEEAATGVNVSLYGHSQVVVQSTESLESNAAGGGERPKDTSDDPENVKYVTMHQSTA